MIQQLWLAVLAVFLRKDLLRALRWAQMYFSKNALCLSSYLLTVISKIVCYEWSLCFGPAFCHKFKSGRESIALHKFYITLSLTPTLFTNKTLYQSCLFSHRCFYSIKWQSPYRIIKATVHAANNIRVALINFSAITSYVRLDLRLSYLVP